MKIPSGAGTTHLPADGEVPGRGWEKTAIDKVGAYKNAPSQFPVFLTA